MKNLDSSIKDNARMFTALSESSSRMFAALNESIVQSERRGNDKLGGYVPKDEFKEFRDENRENFNRLFKKMDDLKDQVATKADR